MSAHSMPAATRGQPMRSALLGFFAWILLMGGAGAREAVDLELVLAVDISG